MGGFTVFRTMHKNAVTQGMVQNENKVSHARVCTHAYAHFSNYMVCPFRFTSVQITSSRLFRQSYFIVLIKPLEKAAFVIVIIAFIIIFSIELLISSLSSYN